MSSTWEISTWAERQFGNCELGDRRRTKRLVKLAAQAAAKPDASTPEQTERWTDCKAAYRLFDQEDVTFEAVTAPHQASSRVVVPGTWLVLNDTTELDFGYQREIPGIGRTGTNGGRGFLLHSALIVAADGDEIVGLAAQDLSTRPLEKVKRVASRLRRNRPRETDYWGRVIDRVGPPPPGVRFLHVCDRGADNFEVYCHLLKQRTGWVIRAAQLKRKVRDEQDRERTLEEAVNRSPCLGAYELTVGGNREQPARTARLEVRAAKVVLPRPKNGVGRYVRDAGVTAVTMWAVEAREVRPPAGVEPLRWVLLTSEEARSFTAAWRTIELYEKRPLIEEYHKCLKTGCRVESRQYRSGDRLAPVIGLLSVLAVRLLQLKTAARKEPERAAEELVPATWLRALPLVSNCKTPIKTIREFFHRLAGLGGFLGRKSDGEPGRQTIWRGLDTLLLCLRGAETLRQNYG